MSRFPKAITCNALISACEKATQWRRALVTLFFVEGWCRILPGAWEKTLGYWIFISLLVKTKGIFFFGL